MVILKRIAVTIYILVPLYLAGFAIGSAAREEMLIQIVLPQSAWQVGANYAASLR